VLGQCQQADKKSNRLVFEGIKLHDKEDYAGAIKKYREAIAAWPQNGLAHFELGLSLYCQQLVAAGEKPPREEITVNSGRKAAPEVTAAYARARQHDPFQIKAYQGDDQEVIRGFLALAKKGMPAWEKVAKGGAVADDVLDDLSAACQEANNHELALAARQILVARRNSYAPTDHPFITASLRKLVPGKQTEEVLKRLAGGQLELRQLVAPTKESP
jgi:tetratricopeptide (TPR) repeat protein